MLVSVAQYNLVYDALSFSLATMGATTIFCWMRVSSIAEAYKSALIITGLVTFIATYHYIRIFDSWVAAYEWTADGQLQTTGIPFNDAYRYMDWLLTGMYMCPCYAIFSPNRPVPLLLIEIVLVMKLTPEETNSKAISLGVAAALMIVLGYPGEASISQDTLGTRWFYWTLAMIPFLYIVYTLLIGLAAATNAEENPSVRNLIRYAQLATIVSWCTYPVVYLFPMLGISGPSAVVFIQLGYSVSDIIAKCGVGLLVYKITTAKSMALRASTGGGESAPLMYGT